MAGLAVAWGEWSGHLSIFPMLARRAGTTLAVVAYTPGRLVILAGGYVDKEVTGYVDIGWALKSPTKVPVRWVVSSRIVLRHRRWMGRITGLPASMSVYFSRSVS